MEEEGAVEAPVVDASAVATAKPAEDTGPELDADGNPIAKEDDDDEEEPGQHVACCYGSGPEGSGSDHVWSGSRWITRSCRKCRTAGFLRP